MPWLAYTVGHLRDGFQIDLVQSRAEMPLLVVYVPLFFFAALSGFELGRVLENVLSNTLTWIVTVAMCGLVGLYRSYAKQRGDRRVDDRLCDDRQAGPDSYRAAPGNESLTSPSGSSSETRSRPRAAGRNDGGSSAKNGMASLWQVAYLVELGVEESVARLFSSGRAGAEIDRRRKSGEAKKPDVRDRREDATLWQVAYLVKLGMPEEKARLLTRAAADEEIKRRKR